jgi:hypothetical protein
MLRKIFTLLLLAGSATLFGCAHPLAIAPDLNSLAGSSTQKVDRGVGLFISESNRKLEVTTPGGGGDKVSYLPYRDLETGLFVALSESFTRVSRITGPADPKVAGDMLSFVVTPRLQTTSFSDSVLTWPPTLFTIELTCDVADAQGKPVAQIRTVGDGRATFDEFKSNTSLAANRAADDLLKKFVKALSEAVQLR